MPIRVTRALLNAALAGQLKDTEFRVDPNFGFLVPLAVEGVEGKILNPRETWTDGAAYDQAAQALVRLFTNNFVQFSDSVDESVLAAAPPGLVDA